MFGGAILLSVSSGLAAAGQAGCVAAQAAVARCRAGFLTEWRAAVAQLGAAALSRGRGRLGHCHPSGWGHCWCPPRAAVGASGCLLAVLPVPAGFLLAAKKRRLKREL